MSFLIPSLFISLTVWAKGFIENPACDVDKKAQERFGQLKGNAGCFILENNKLLVVEVAKSKNKLSPPGGGNEKNESAQCTAARETLEEAGAHVKVYELLYNYEDDFYLFWCELKDKSLVSKKSLPVNPQFKDEISKIYWLDLSQSQESAWRFQKQFRVLKGIFEYRKSN